jgi:hypothetical protein
VTYATADAAVRATIGAGADDGTTGEGDEIGDGVEVLVGSRFADHLSAGDGAARAVRARR